MHLKKLALAVAACLALALPANADPIRIASKSDTEGSLLGNLMLVLLQARGIEARGVTPIASSKLIRAAILSGEVDLYPEYTGNGAFFSNSESDPVWKSAEGGYRRVRDFDAANHVVWLAPAPANNTWALAVRADLAQSAQLTSVADLARYVNGGGAVKLAGSSEFVESPAALPAFQKAYGFSLRADQVVILSGGDTAGTEQAAATGASGVNAAMAYGTDGQLAALNLVVLGDPKQVQMVFEPAPVIREEVLKGHPEIEGMFAPVFRSLSLETLQSLNARIAVDGEDPRSVAAAYLKARGFVK